MASHFMNPGNGMGGFQSPPSVTGVAGADMFQAAQQQLFQQQQSSSQQTQPPRMHHCGNDLCSMSHSFSSVADVGDGAGIIGRSKSERRHRRHRRKEKRHHKESKKSKGSGDSNGSDGSDKSFRERVEIGAASRQARHCHATVP